VGCSRSQLTGNSANKFGKKLLDFFFSQKYTVEIAKLEGGGPDYCPTDKIFMNYYQLDL
jgi:hypothetical protein